LIETLAPVAKPTVLEVKPDAAPAPAAEATPEQTAIIADLHWLAHQGHIIEFADGKLETAKKPLPKPVKAEKKPAVEKAEKPAAEGEAIAATQAAPQAEAAAEPVAAEAPATTEAVASAPEAPIVAEPTPTEPVTSPS
jgi:hypothetical protein